MRPDLDGLIADAQRLAAILDDLLLAADPRGSRPDRPIDLDELADEVVAACAATARTTRIRLARAAVSTEPAWVCGTAAGLHRALTAMVDNAIRHANSEVRVAVTRADGRIVLEVADDGPGIDGQLLPRLFDRFASDPAGTDTGRRRYGLGLALVSEIADRHGGTVSAANRDGGAVLWIELPVLSTRPRLQESSETALP